MEGALKPIREKIKADTTQGGSSAGYSFYKKYQGCPRKFALEELLGVNTTGTKWALVQGSILHGVMECLYLGYSAADQKKYILEMSDVLLNTDEEKQKMILRVSEMLRVYKKQWYESDMKEYDSFLLEHPIDIPLYGGMKMTGRIDKLYRCKDTGVWIIGDYKTTGMHLKAAIGQAAQGDQFTLYSYAMKTAEPEKRFGVVIDAIYGRDLKAGFKVNLQRDSLKIYQAYELQQTAVGFTGLVIEVSQKIKSYLNGDAPLEFLFPRNGTTCGIFGCPYKDFCRQKVTGLHLEGAGCTYDREKVKNLQDFKDFEVRWNEK